MAIILIVGVIAIYMENIMVPLKRVTSLSLEPVNMLPFMSRDVVKVVNWRILKWGDYPRFPRWTQCNHKRPYKGKRKAGEPEKGGWNTNAEVRERDLKMTGHWL